MDHRILVVDNEDDNLISTKLFLTSHGYSVDTAANGKDAIEAVRNATVPYALVILDYHMPEKNGAATARELREINPDIYILIYSGDGQNSDIVKTSWDIGAVKFIDKDEEPEIFLDIVKRWCIKFDETTRTIVKPLSFSLNETAIRAALMIGRSAPLADIAETLKTISLESVTPPILITGENGSGKEVIAKAIHAMGPRRSFPFIAINCGAVPENLIESELFGHEKGAFTGAIQKQLGKFQQAGRGTILLDEIGEASLSFQVKLLRVLQEKVFTPVGGNREVALEANILFATNRDLKKSVTEKTFREDLFYRISGCDIHVPPLRERPEDIEPLVLHFCEEINKKYGKNKTFLMRTIRMLEDHSWPGNVRELYRLVEKLIIRAPIDKISPEHLDAEYFSEPIESCAKFEDLIKRQEKEQAKYLARVLASSSSLRDAAQKVGLSKSTFHHTARRLKVLKSDVNSSGASSDE